jgi:hypothetical protein
MMHARWLALPLAAVTGCASSPAPRLLSADLHLGALDQRTAFELDDRGSDRVDERDAPDDDVVDTPKKQRTRRLLYFTGLGAIGFGVVGTLGFGIGGRIVQAQMKNGYEDGSLTRDRQEQLDTTGEVMNGLAIGSAVVGLLGIITAAAVYGVDHSRCGELPPRRKQCDGKAAADAPADPGPAPADAGPRPTAAPAPAETSPAPAAAAEQ